MNLKKGASKFRIPNVGTRHDVSLASFKIENQRYLKEAIRRIEDSLVNGKNVFVYCREGINHSPIIIIAYLMSKYQVPFEKALAFVTSKRQLVQLHPLSVKFLMNEFKPLDLKSTTLSPNK